MIFKLFNTHTAVKALLASTACSILSWKWFLFRVRLLLLLFGDFGSRAKQTKQRASKTL